MEPAESSQDLINSLSLNQFKSPASFVMVLNHSIPLETINWLITILKESHFELSIVSETKPINLNEDLTLLINCPEKILKENVRFVYKQLTRQYLGDSTTTTKDELNSAEKQRILYYLIQKISSPNRSSVVGLPDITLYPGQSIIEICCHENIISHFFPLHDYEHLDNLRLNYCSYFGNNLDYVRNYFGEMIGFYFAFLNSYKDMFCVASMIYFLCYLFYIPFEIYTMILCFGTFVFIKIWKRLSKKLAFRWGTLDLIELEKPRPAFRSKGMKIDPITQQMIPFYPIFKTWWKEYLISVPFVIICLYLSFELMCFYFVCEDWMIVYYDWNPCLLTMIGTYIPGIAYALIVTIFDILYIIVATKLNDYENHKTQESHENHLIVKLVLFEFFNNFISLFYIAFYLQEMEMLKYNLITMLTVNKTVENVLEVFQPMFRIYWKRPKIFGAKMSWKEQISHEKNLYIYDETFYDCLELFIQFGYAFLFIAIWPWAPLVACFNSVLEVRMDAIKLSYCKRRPFQKSMKSINRAWIKSFEVMSIVVVISNFLVLSMVSENVRLWSVYYTMSRFELMVYVEHVFLGMVLIFYYIVPDISKDVYLQSNRKKYLQLIEDNEKKTN